MGVGIIRIKAISVQSIEIELGLTGTELGKTENKAWFYWYTPGLNINSLLKIPVWETKFFETIIIV